jgi:hypothetical protein
MKAIFQEKPYPIWQINNQNLSDLTKSKKIKNSSALWSQSDKTKNSLLCKDQTLSTKTKGFPRTQLVISIDKLEIKPFLMGMHRDQGKRSKTKAHSQRYSIQAQNIQQVDKMSFIRSQFKS